MAIPQRESPMAEQERQAETAGEKAKPDSTGTNSRPRDETIAQTGPGIPDDSSEPVEVDPGTEKRLEDKIRSM
jgi:hypothetical protein